MDAAGVDIHAISVVPTLYHYWADALLANDIVAAANERTPWPSRESPTAWSAWPRWPCSIPSWPPTSCAWPIPSSACGAWRSPPRWRAGICPTPSWTRSGPPRRISARGSSSTRGGAAWAPAVPHFLGNTFGQPAETTLALYHLVFGGVLDRFPPEAFAAHGGGYLPNYLGRADHAYEVRPESRRMARPPSAYLDSMYFDALVYTDHALPRLLGCGPDQVARHRLPLRHGRHRPRRPHAAPGLPPADLAAIAGGNAARLLRLTDDIPPA